MGECGYRANRPQGFYELCNLQEESVVTWKNVFEIKVVPQPEVSYQEGKKMEPVEESGVAASVNSKNGPPGSSRGFPQYTSKNSSPNVPPWAFILVALIIPIIIGFILISNFRVTVGSFTESLKNYQTEQNKLLERNNKEFSDLQRTISTEVSELRNLIRYNSEEDKEFVNKFLVETKSGINIFEDGWMKYFDNLNCQNTQMNLLLQYLPTSADIVTTFTCELRKITDINEKNIQLLIETQEHEIKSLEKQLEKMRSSLEKLDHSDKEKSPEKENNSIIW